MDTLPWAVTQKEAEEIAAIQDVRDMWGDDSAEEFARRLVKGGDIYVVKFNYTSGGPGYVGDYFIVQGDALGEPPIQIIRVDGELVMLP